jgi:hypothetical protein
MDQKQAHPRRFTKEQKDLTLNSPIKELLEKAFILQTMRHTATVVTLIIMEME